MTHLYSQQIEQIEEQERRWHVIVLRTLFHACGWSCVAVAGVCFVLLVVFQSCHAGGLL